MDKEKLALFKGLVEGAYAVKYVAAKLGVTERSVRITKQNFIEHGESALVHGNSGRRPANYFINDDLQARIADLKKSDAYDNVSVPHFKELMAEREGIKISYSALLEVLKEREIVPRTNNKRKAGTSKVKAAFGQMLGIAAVSHDWFRNGTPRVLHCLADAATRRATGLYLCDNECIKGYTEVLRQTMKNHGIPLELHAENAETLFGGDPRLCDIIENRLGIDIIADADTPRLRKRREYLWNALRKHLLRWLKTLDIADMERANRQLHLYMPVFNERFSKEPLVAESCFVPLGDHNPDLLLAIRHEAVTDDAGRFFFGGFVFSVDSEQPPAHKKIEFLFGEGIGFLAHYDGEYHKVSFHGAKYKDRIVQHSKALKILVQENYCIDLGNLRDAKFDKEFFPN